MRSWIKYIPALVLLGSLSSCSINHGAGVTIRHTAPIPPRDYGLYECGTEKEPKTCITREGVAYIARLHEALRKDDFVFVDPD